MMGLPILRCWDDWLSHAYLTDRSVYFRRDRPVICENVHAAAGAEPHSPHSRHSHHWMDPWRFSDTAGCSLPTESSSPPQDRKSTRLNSSHVAISYADFCLKKKNIHK